MVSKYENLAAYEQNWEKYKQDTKAMKKMEEAMAGYQDVCTCRDHGRYTRFGEGKVNQLLGMNTGDSIFLLLNVALAFYNAGTIWAHEVDIFRSWKYLDAAAFHTVQRVHWKKLPYWIFIPVGLSFIGSIALFWIHPGKMPGWEIGAAFGSQLLSHILTALFWGPWQAKLAKDDRGGASPMLARILRTHWVRTTLITLYAFILLVGMIQVLKN